MNAGAGLAATVLGIPAAAFAIGLFAPAIPMIHASTLKYHAEQWKRRELPIPEDETLLAGMYLDVIPTGLQDPAGIPRRKPIRPVPWSEAIGTVPGWLAAPSSRQRAYVTLGTVAYGAVEVLRRALDDLGGLDLDVLVAVGPEGDPTLLGSVPDSVHVERFVDQSRVLPLVDVVVHHGGTGTMLGCLANGLPQLILPQGADQFHNGGLVTDAGAGMMLHNDDQLPGAIAEQATALLADGPERAAARRFRESIAAQPAPADVVPELVRFAGG